MPTESAPPSDGCRLCGSTWGNWWEEIAGRREFFCCELCAVQWKSILHEVQAATGWPTVDYVRLTGSRWGRSGEAGHSAQIFEFEVAFTPEGALRRFHRIVSHGRAVR